MGTRTLAGIGLALLLTTAVARTAGAQESTTARGPDVGWLRGKWAFDAEYTARKHAELEATEGLGGLVVAQLMASLEGSRLTITDREEIFTTKDDNGKAGRYEVLEVPDADTVSLKDEDGEVTAYHREGDRMWFNSTGTVRVPFYFKRVE